MDRERSASGAGRAVSRLPETRHGRRLLGTGDGEAVLAVLVAEDQALQDEVARVAAAAGVDIPVAPGIPDALALAPDVLLLGSGHLRFLAEQRGASRALAAARPIPAGTGKPETIVVGLSEDSTVWDLAAGSSAARVAVLPAAAGWLAGFLGRRRSFSGGTVVGVLGGGGAGASTVACWLSANAAEAGSSVLLLEGDAWGSGLEWALGAADLEGIRWPDLEGVSGSLNPVQLAAGLPALAGFSLLGRGTGSPSADEAVVGAVLDAARSAYQLTIVDLGRAIGAASPLRFCDQALMVVPGRTSGVLGAQALLPHLGPVPARVVVRGPLGNGLDEVLVAEALGSPLSGYLPFHRGTGREYGQVLAGAGRPRIRRASQRILATVLPAPVGVAS
ncbi:hypothetical protein N2K95_13670 [Arthrobacter zhaoxinii]|uniref:Helicase/secretion neighborhood CpaE-like protein n=1 Tax=Arthrobacter zhaoxinii TaxID=2964616 RepID=A0ABY5YRM0_9MICC|nr:septum site-determining protein Ssd [Arthrobacter zhaoxinii]UWX96679.1 hypothetical protein N2K95_13670 [Arthrobacter zhaoxinii]